jgi:hypothetical protein
VETKGEKMRVAHSTTAMNSENALASDMPRTLDLFPKGYSPSSYDKNGRVGADLMWPTNSQVW